MEKLIETKLTLFEYTHFQNLIALISFLDNYMCDNLLNKLEQICISNKSMVGLVYKGGCAEVREAIKEILDLLDGYLVSFELISHNYWYIYNINEENEDA